MMLNGIGLDKLDINKYIKEQPLAKIDSSPSMHVSETSSDNLVSSEKSKKLAQIK